MVGLQASGGGEGPAAATLTLHSIMKRDARAAYTGHLILYWCNYTFSSPVNRGRKWLIAHAMITNFSSRAMLFVKMTNISY